MEEKGEDGEKLKKELSASHQFLMDTEMKVGRLKVFNFQMSNLDTKKPTKNLMKSSTSSILPLKSTLLWVLFFEILQMMNIDTSTSIKTTIFLKDPTHCVR